MDELDKSQFCIDCRHCWNGWGREADTTKWECHTKVIYYTNYQNGKKCVRPARCHEKNTNGKCPDYGHLYYGMGGREVRTSDPDESFYRPDNPQCPRYKDFAKKENGDD